MAGKTAYEPDFDADQLPVWFIDTEGTIAYHLYPDCGHINHHSERALSKMTIKGFGSVETLDEWEEQIKSHRHMCHFCMNRFKKEWFASEL